MSLAPSAPRAAGLAIPVAPADPSVADQWANPAVRAGEGTLARVSLVSAPAIVGAHDPIKATVLITNTSRERLEGLSLTPRRGPATGSVGDQRAATVANPSDYSVVGSTVDVDTPLAPGESTQLELSITEDALPLPGIGTYPLMFVLSGPGGDPLDTERFHVTVRGTPQEAVPAGMTTLFPVSAPVDIVPGETGAAPGEPPLILASESLADQLAPGGRLSSLIDVYSTASTDPAVADSTCLALDPALIHTVDRMAEGYTVSQARPSLADPPKRLRDSWGEALGSPTDPAAGSPGRGSEDAHAWLGRLTAIAATRCVIALPWANADLNAVARTGDTWLMREAVERGPAVLAQVLGASGVKNTVVPGAGYALPGVPQALGWADHSRSRIETEGMHGAWERAQAAADAESREDSGPAEAGSAPALDRSDVPSIAAAAAPEPGEPVRVLLAANGVRVSEPGRFSWLAPGVMAVTYQDSLSAVLATVGEHPETAGYSNDYYRFDYTLDSPKARSVNAASAVHLAAQEAWTYRDPGEADPAADSQPEAGHDPDPVLINPPATWDADSAADVMDAVASTLHTQAARPMPLEDYLAAPPGRPIGAGEVLGSPFADPSAYTDTEILASSQQARFINELSSLLVQDPAIALTRYGFTLPLRRDILSALSASGRRALTFYGQAESATRSRLGGSRDALNALRSAVALIPPGNVYTRTSPTSPLLIVARNGLPLPVDATVRYIGPEEARLNVPATLRLPAHGSITMTMTADLPEQPGGTDLKLFLATPRGDQISEPVDIAVRTAGVALRGWFVVTALAAALAMLLLFNVGKRRRLRRQGASHPPPSRGHTP
ncbi:hypothetical protein C3E79_11135 [Corynebacterium liangguodongii]|uniref:Uncharacterized protein n=1 Tax=Corynebacterium liangguodongii TaxID=2079535 RepID=A0A2S0WHI2_9CORY|nr:hypothetical protein C3E79_11135 [Corynebacterium liangguodongii]PWB99415.1 hypothetical protein DF219_07140 [Corynebacterium liangguodongii]